MEISIHAPREGGDFTPLGMPLPLYNFNPRPPRGGRLVSLTSTLPEERNFNPRPPRGGRRVISSDLRRACVFQSTPPARGATSAQDGAENAGAGISIHAPREGGDNILSDAWEQIEISIHAPREGGDTDEIKVIKQSIVFQSTPPARGATNTITQNTPKRSISIHAPREGGDSILWFTPLFPCYFNPRPPRGGRRCFGSCRSPYPVISIHAPREGGDIVCHPFPEC